MERRGATDADVASFEDRCPYFYLFGVRRRSDGMWLAWVDVVRLAQRVGLRHCPVVMHPGIYSSADLRREMIAASERPSGLGVTCRPEGFVVRVCSAFTDVDFSSGAAVAKFVRANHVQTKGDWKRTWCKAKVREEGGN